MSNPSCFPTTTKIYRDPLQVEEWIFRTLTVLPAPGGIPLFSDAVWLIPVALLAGAVVIH